jgi:signal peptidase I
MTMRRWIILSLLVGMLAGCDTRASSGDRVLVSKEAYDTGVMEPARYNVVVFKYPDRPVKQGTPTNYIKRLLGLPGELLAILFGRVYRWTPQPGDEPPFNDLKVDLNDRCQKHYMHVNEKTVWFEDGYDKNDGKIRGFEILRKPPHVLLAMRRIVYDNDYQAADLKGKLDRWTPKANSDWKHDAGTGFICESKPGERVDWLRYQHLLRPEDGPVGAEAVKPSLICDVLDYNSFESNPPRNASPDVQHWVGDLMLECNLDVTETKGEVWFEINRGKYRYQACFDLADGNCTLFSIAKDGAPKKLDMRPTRIKGPGSYLVRFANIDARLTVWVDRDLPFGDGHPYDPPDIRGLNEKHLTRAEIEDRRGPTENDLKPASIGAKAAKVKISHLRLWRDTYYTTSATARDGDYGQIPDRAILSDPSKYAPLIRSARSMTLYVQPGHYLCLGDNSQASSDSRDWGTVPERLMLGRALVVYYPIDRMGPIR